MAHWSTSTTRTEKRDDEMQVVSGDSLLGPISYVMLPLCSMTISAVLLAVTSDSIGNELAAISSDPEGWRALSLFAWRVFELWAAWGSGYDDLDSVTLTLQTRAPYYILLRIFYGISNMPLIAWLAIDVFSTGVAFNLLGRCRRFDYKELITMNPDDGLMVRSSVAVIVTITGASIYALILYVSAVTFLPEWMATHFDGVVSFAVVHKLQLPTLIACFIPLGWAACNFLISSSTTPPSYGNGYLDSRSSAVFPWTLNVLIQDMMTRTFFLTVMMGFGTAVRVWGALDGSTLTGACGIAIIWGAAGFWNGAFLIWVRSGALAIEDETLMK